ncbi:MAG: hypothetical protein OXO54_12860 [Chloroflexota bacterium]|nr:hypothetical protein [Chloroflexota bacterium]
MSAEDKEPTGWGSRLDGLIKRVGDEVGGERGEKVRTRLTEAKSRVEAGLESDEARRIRGEMVTLADKALERVDDALRHERTQTVVKRVDATLTEIGDRLRGEDPEPPRSAPPPEAPADAAGSEETAPPTESTAAPPDAAPAQADDATAVREASSVAGDVSPTISTDGEDQPPTQRA